MPDRPLALTFDLDDTLWPNREVILRAEAAFHHWLAERAPRTAAMFPVAEMRALRQSVGLAHPALAHDLSALRLLTTQQALRAAGDDAALAQEGFDVFFAERQRVALYADVPAALDRLAARYTLLALSNGNADLGRTGIAHWFAGSVSARTAGVAKPDARIFHAACAALRQPPAAVMHVGDNWALDVQGARQAGLHSAWVMRPDDLPEGPDASAAQPASGLHLQVSNLLELADALGV